MEDCLEGICDEICIFYLDDVIVYSGMFEECGKFVNSVEMFV